LRILEINSVCGKGSTGRIACQIADTVVSQGEEALIAYGRDCYAKGCNVPVYRIGSDLRVRLHAGFSRITDRQGFYSKRATKKFIEFIKRYNPDLIHLHNLHGYYLHLPIFFNFLADCNKPVVWTLHDCWAFTGHCAHFDYIGCDRWKTGCHHCPQKKMYPKSIVLDQSKRNWEEKKRLFTSLINLTIVTPSHWLSDLVKKSFLQKYPVQVIHNGIDLNIFRPVESSWKNDQKITKPMILTCSAVWNERKGYSDVMKLAKMVPEYQVVIIGITAQQKKTLPSNLFGVLRTNSVEEMVEIYSAADVFINPTYEDNFPTVNLEALACGTPVITYNTGGSPEAITTDCGLVINKGNILEIAEGIRRKIYTKSIINEFCLDRSRSFSSEEKFKLYYKLFEKIGMV